VCVRPRRHVMWAYGILCEWEKVVVVAQEEPARAYGPAARRSAEPAHLSMSKAPQFDCFER
jgi:hypothetical protein